MKLLLSLFLLISCATTEARWYEDAPAFENQTWRICDERLDGKEKALSGFCYISKECRSRFLRSRVCKPLPKFIAFTDKVGVAKLLHSGKVLRKRR